jgi:hypothetical protein
MESDDDYYTVSECLSSKVSSYGSCTPVASDQDDEVSSITFVLQYFIFTVYRECMMIRIYNNYLMISITLSRMGFRIQATATYEYIIT